MIMPKDGLSGIRAQSGVTKLGQGESSSVPSCSIPRQSGILILFHIGHHWIKISAKLFTDTLSRLS